MPSGAAVRWSNEFTGSIMPYARTLITVLALSLLAVSDDDAALRREERRVLGDAIFSSGHPSMQLLNPKIVELFLSLP